MNEDLCWLAVDKCYEGKWHREDVLRDIEKNTPYTRWDLREAESAGSSPYTRLKYEIKVARAQTLYAMMMRISRNKNPHFEDIQIHRRRDGATGKERDIAYLCIEMQLLGHCLQLGLEPLIEARLVYGQSASLPKRGPHTLVRNLQHALNAHPELKYFVKLDCKNAYGSTMYDKIIAIVEKEIPSAKWIHAGLRRMMKSAPGGHLIIGGYLDAWMFNFVMSYALKEAMAVTETRRDHTYKVVKFACTYMDDAVFVGTSFKGLKKAVKVFTEYFDKEWNIVVVQKTDYIKLWSIEEELAHKKEICPGKRGVPSIDVAGYRVSRTHVRLRKRNAVKCIRCFIRAWKQYQKTGTLKYQTACCVISRNGMVRETNCYFLVKKYHIDELLRVAKKIQAYWTRYRQREWKERLRYAVEQHRIYSETQCG